MPSIVKQRLEALRLRDVEEYRRLLYVAMTRARDRLYICGTKKQSTNTSDGWHALVSKALEPDSRKIESNGSVVALEWRPEVGGAAAKRRDKQYAMELPTIPDWARRPAPPAPPSGKRLAPSRVLQPDDASTSSSRQLFAPKNEPDAALVRGRLIHRLLQSLPEQPTDRRRPVGAAYLSTKAPEIDGDVILEEVLAVLEDPRWAPLFAPGSRAEVEIAGQVDVHDHGMADLSGRIDRLAITDTHVFIVDYKTNRPAPSNLGEVPAEYVIQLALYRSILQRLYPAHVVTAALLWTDVPSLMEIPSQLLDQAVSAAIGAELVESQA